MTIARKRKEKEREREGGERERERRRCYFGFIATRDACVPGTREYIYIVGVAALAGKVRKKRAANGNCAMGETAKSDFLICHGLSIAVVDSAARYTCIRFINNLLGKKETFIPDSSRMASLLI